MPLPWKAWNTLSLLQPAPSSAFHDTPAFHDSDNDTDTDEDDEEVTVDEDGLEVSVEDDGLIDEQVRSFFQLWCHFYGAYLNIEILTVNESIGNILARSSPEGGRSL